MLFSNIEAEVNSALQKATSETVQKGGSLEIEFRLRTFTAVDSAGIGSDDAFRRALQLFRVYVNDPVRSEDWEILTPERDKIVYYTDDYRSIQKEGETTKRFEQKTKTTDGYIISSEWPVVMSFATEKKDIQLPSSAQASLSGGIRRRGRWGFMYKPRFNDRIEFMRVDFSKVIFEEKGKNEQETFEIEIEALGRFEPITKVEEGFAYSQLHMAMSEVGIELLRYVYDTPIAYSKTLRSTLIATINHKFDRESKNNAKIPTGFVNKPKPLEWKDLEYGESSIFPPEGSNQALYAVTIKTDGVRIFTFFHETGIYLFNPLAGLFVKISSEKIAELEGTMLDGELLAESTLVTQKEFSIWVFDCLFLGNDGVTDDVRNLSLPDRLKRARWVESKLNQLQTTETKVRLHVKSFFPFYDRDSFYLANKKALALNIKNGIEIFKSDGLVYTDMGPYLRRTKPPPCKCKAERGSLCDKCRSWTSSLNRKYKPVDLLTTDFLIKESEDNQMHLHVHLGAEGTVPFTGDKTLKVDSTRFKTTFVKDGVEEEVRAGKIYEFKWDKFEMTWVPLRMRTDRLEPNNLSTAQSNWRLIVNDIPPGILLGKLKGQRALHLMRKYQNKIKVEALSHWSNVTKAKLAISGEIRRPRLFDIGAGSGGSIPAWKITEYDVIALEPSAERLDELEKRLVTYGMTGRVQTIQMKAQDAKKILPKFETILHKVDVVSSFHSMTLIYESMEVVMDFIKTVKGVLKVGGVFICMAMDGAAIHSQLGQFKQVDMEGIKIQRSKDNPRKITVKVVANDASLARGQSEYLVDFDHLISLFEREGFELVNDNHLDTGTLLSDSELWWCQMTRLIEMRYVEAKEIPDATKELQMLSDLLESTMISPQVDTDSIIEIDQRGTTQLGSQEGQKFWLVGVLAGGSSFFHALLWAIDLKYRSARGNVNFRFERVLKLRFELAAKLKLEDIPSGYIKTEGTFSLEGMKETLAEYTHWCGGHLIPFIEKELDVNIHVISWVGGELNPIRNLKDTFVDSRMNVILHSHDNGRFEPVGRSLSGQSDIASFTFSSGDELVLRLKTFYN